MDTRTRTVAWSACSDVMAVAGLIGGIILGLVFAIAGRDGVIVFHGWLFVAVSAAACLFLLTRTIGGRGQRDDTGYFDGPVRVAVIATMFWRVIGFSRRRHHCLATGVSSPQP